MKTIKIITLFIFCGCTVLAQKDIDIESILGSDEKYSSNTYSNIQASNYDNYEYNKYFRVLIEGDFDLMPELSNYIKYWDEHHISQSPGVTLTQICFYYLIYIDRNCQSILKENTLQIKKVRSFPRQRYSHTEFYGSDLLVDIYNSYSEEFVIVMEINPELKAIWDFCEKPLNGSEGEFTRLLEITVKSDKPSFSKERDIQKFFIDEIKCDKKTLETMGENIIRMLQNKQSIQQEKGFY